jgi:light-harvesting complex I chlorophyll a/b binding protein 1
MLGLASAALSFSAPTAPAVAPRAAPVSMKVQDLVGGINDPIFGGTPEGKVFDPLGLGADTSALYRRRCVEIKHGRICMVAFLGMTIGPNDLFAPSHAFLSPSQGIHFDDVPGGMAALNVVPGAGWAQIVALVGIHELTINKQDYTKVPGEIPTFLGFKPDDPKEFADKQVPCPLLAHVLCVMCPLRCCPATPRIPAEAHTSAQPSSTLIYNIFTHLHALLPHSLLNTLPSRPRAAEGAEERPAGDDRRPR